MPTNFALNAEELRYVIQQSGARALISDISLAATVEQAVQGAELILQAHFYSSESANIDVLQLALADLPDMTPEVSVADDDIAQFLYPQVPLLHQKRQ